MNAATVDSLPGQVVYLNNQTSNAVLVNVTGKGELHYVLGESMNSGSCYKIELDGETFYARNPYSNNRVCGYFAKEPALYIEASQGTSLNASAFLDAARKQLSFFLYERFSRNYIPLGELSQEAFETSKENSKTAVLYTQKPLRFEQSLKITIDGTASEGGYNYIKYTLDD